jgi:hypothetical protein
MSYQVQEVTPETVIQSLSLQLSAEKYWCRRYREALRQIAAGEGDPEKIAWEALGDDED